MTDLSDALAARRRAPRRHQVTTDPTALPAEPEEPDVLVDAGPVPRDRGICGAAAPTLTPSTYGGVCDLLAGHSGWHRDGGMSWVDRSYDPVERERAAFERGKAEERARLIAALEARDSLLCDCGHEDTCGGSQPTNPMTKQPMDHHCDCSAVDAAATLLGDRKKTRHAAQCIDLDPRFGGSDA